MSIFSKQERNLIIFALRADTKNYDSLRSPKNPHGFGPRTFDPIEELDIAMRIGNKVREIKGSEDAEIEFSTGEKALLLELLKRPWLEEDAGLYFSLKGKLE